MAINFNPTKLDSLLTTVYQSCSKYGPTIKQHLNLTDCSSKADIIFDIIINWQNVLYNIINHPSKFFIENDVNYDAFRNSQKTLNKIKRKFNKLFLEGMTVEYKRSLAEIYLKHMGKPNNQANIENAYYVFEHFGYDEICLKVFSQFMGQPLFSSTKPPYELLDTSPCGKEHPGPLLLGSILATVAAAPLASNTFKYRGQESTPLTEPTFETMNSCNERLKHARNEVIQNRTLYIQQNRWSRLLQMSWFKSYIFYAKGHDGNLIQNCTERAEQIFYRLVRERKFNYAALVTIEANPNFHPPHNGNHMTVTASPPNDSRKFILEGWNDAIVYPENRAGEFLYDYVGTDDNGNAITRPINPITQEIIIQAFSIFPCNEFNEFSPTKNPQLIKLLEQFHHLSDRREKMLKALEITHFIENKMPLYELYDKPVHELYDQMIFLTKKERKAGLTFIPNDADRCQIDEILQRGDKNALITYVAEKGNQDMSPVTILHAIKAALRTEDYGFYSIVIAANPPIEHSPLTQKYHPDPAAGIKYLALDLLFKPLQ